jgi:hypothetical protein
LENLCNASVLVYGPSKVGKTHFVASGPPPVLIMDAEGGTRFLPFKKVIWSNPLLPPPEMGDATVCVVYVRDFSTLENVYTWLHSGQHPFRTVAVDSISEAQQRCVDAIAGQKQMTTPDWGTLLRKISALVRGYRDLLIHPLNPLDCVAFTSFERVSQDGVHSPYLQGAIANVLSYYLDMVFYYASSPDGETGKQVRKLLTKPHQFFLAGDRTNRLPTVVEDPTLQSILALACDLDAPLQEGDPFPDLAAVAVSDDGASPPAGASETGPDQTPASGPGEPTDSDKETATS